MNSTNTDTVPEVIKRIKSILNDVPGLQLAILYGSAVTGRMRKDSDVDIALLFDRPMSAQQKMELISHVESELRRDVDLADLYALNGTILKQILSKGRVLVQSTPGVLAGLVQRMVYNQADMMPYITRTLIERQKRFING